MEGLQERPLLKWIDSCGKIWREDGGIFAGYEFDAKNATMNLSLPNLREISYVHIVANTLSIVYLSGKGVGPREVSDMALEMEFVLTESGL